MVRILPPIVNVRGYREGEEGGIKRLKRLSAQSFTYLLTPLLSFIILLQ